MNDYSKALIEDMNGLAESSLPPDLFEKWEELYLHYSERPVTNFSFCHMANIEQCGDVVAEVPQRKTNVVFYFDQYGCLLYCRKL